MTDLRQAAQAVVSAWKAGELGLGIKEFSALEAALAAQQALGEIVVTHNQSGQIVAVTRQDEEGRILSVIAESAQQAAQPVAPSDTEWSIIHALVNCAMATESDAAMHQIDRLAKHYGMKDKRGQSLRAKLLRHEQLQHPRRPFRLTPSEAAQPQHTAQPLAKQLSRGQIGDIVREHLRGLYYCGRVWEAWSVGTMSEDDFSPAEELDTADEIADSLWAGMTQASWAAQPPAQPDKEHNHE